MAGRRPLPYPLPPHTYPSPLPPPRFPGEDAVLDVHAYKNRNQHLSICGIKLPNAMSMENYKNNFDFCLDFGATVSAVFGNSANN